MNSFLSRFPQPSARMMEAAREETIPVPDWMLSLQKKAEKLANRPRNVSVTPLQSYHKDFGFSFTCDIRRIFLPTGKVRRKKDGTTREELRPAGFILRAQIVDKENRILRKFSVVARTDPTKVSFMQREIERICGLDAAAAFAKDAAEILASRS